MVSRGSGVVLQGMNAVSVARFFHEIGEALLFHVDVRGTCIISPKRATWTSQLSAAFILSSLCPFHKLTPTEMWVNESLQ